MTDIALTISSKLLATEWHHRRTTSSSEADHKARRELVRAATLEWDLAETSLSKVDQILLVGSLSFVP